MKNLKIVVHTKNFGKIEASWVENISQDDYNEMLSFCQKASKGELTFLTLETGVGGCIKKIIPKSILETSIIEVVLG